MRSKEKREKLRDFFIKSTGIIASEQQLDVMSDEISKRIEKFDFINIDEYLHALEFDFEHTEELKNLVNQVTINESYFFRDSNQMDFLENVYFPKLIANRREKNTKVLKIWSAGCSAGQEIYSIAIMLDRLIKDYDDWAIQLLGTDIDTNMIETGVLGRYTEWATRNLDKMTCEQYFIKEGDEYILEDKIKNRAILIYHNLANDDYPSFLNGTSGLDLIICRNVFLYFGENLCNKVINKFSRCLTKNGLLMLGVADIKNFDEGIFSKQKSNEITYYQKVYASQEDKNQIEVESEPRKESTSFLKSGRSEIRIGETFRNKHKFDEQENLYELATKHLESENWPELISLADNLQKIDKTTIPIALYKGLALANLGKLDEALHVCETLQKKDDLNAENYLIQSLIYREKQDYLESEKKIKQSIFLNKDSIDAYYCLGTLYLRQNKINAGLKELRTAIRKIDKSSEAKRLYISPRVTYQEFKAILEEEVKSYAQDGRR